MRSSVLALALPLVAALPSFPPSNDLAAGGGVVKRWKFNPNKESNIEVTAADVDMYKKMGWTTEQIKQLDPNAPVGTQEPQVQQGGSPSNDVSVNNHVPNPELPDGIQRQTTPKTGLDRLNGETNKLSTSNEGQQGPPGTTEQTNRGVVKARPTGQGNNGPNSGMGGGGGGNEGPDNASGSSNQAGDWLAIANKIRQSLPRESPLPMLTQDSALEAAARARSAASVSQDASTLTHTPQGQLQGHEVMHFGKASEFREVVWGWLCEMPQQLGITKQCANVRNTRHDMTGHAEAFTNPDLTRIGCGHQESNNFGGQWTCVLSPAK